MLFKIQIGEAKEFASSLRLTCKSLEEAASELEAVAKEIDSNNTDFMSTHEVGGNLDLAAKAIQKEKENIETIAKALDDVADMASQHENKVLAALKQKTQK